MVRNRKVDRNLSVTRLLYIIYMEPKEFAPKCRLREQPRFTPYITAWVRQPRVRLLIDESGNRPCS
jgi:hypothetical protein